MQCVAGPGSGLCPTLNSKPPLRGNIFGLLPCSVHSVVNIVTIKSNYLGRLHSQKVDDALCSSCLCMWCVSHMNPWFVNAIYTFTDELFSARRLFKVVFSGLFLEGRF